MGDVWKLSNADYCPRISRKPSQTIKPTTSLRKSTLNAVANTFYAKSTTESKSQHLESDPAPLCLVRPHSIRRPQSSMCAQAIRLARELNRARILQVSTQPKVIKKRKHAEDQKGSLRRELQTNREGHYKKTIIQLGVFGQQPKFDTDPATSPTCYTFVCIQKNRRRN